MPGERIKPWNNTVVVLVGRVHRGVLQAIQYAKSLNVKHLVAVSVVSDEEEDASDPPGLERVRHRRPARDRLQPVPRPPEAAAPLHRRARAANQSDVVTVVIPEFVVHHWWEHLLHNQSALFLKARLLFSKNTVVTSVPYHVDEDEGGAVDPAPDSAQRPASG